MAIRYDNANPFSGPGRRLMEEVLAKEEEPAEDMRTLIGRLSSAGW